MAKTKKYLKSRKSKKCRKSRKNFRYKHRGGTVDEPNHELSSSISRSIITDLEKMEEIVFGYGRRNIQSLMHFAPMVIPRYSCKGNNFCELIKAYIYFILIHFNSSYVILIEFNYRYSNESDHFGNIFYEKYKKHIKMIKFKDDNFLNYLNSLNMQNIRGNIIHIIIWFEKKLNMFQNKTTYKNVFDKFKDINNNVKDVLSIQKNQPPDFFAPTEIPSEN